MESNGLRATLVGAVAAALLALAPAASGLGPLPGSDPAPYGANDAGGFRNVLPAGEAGVDNTADLGLFEANGRIPPHFNDQLPLYANLVYADPTLTDAQVPNYFKDATFGVRPGDVGTTESPASGLTIIRDSS